MPTNLAYSSAASSPDEQLAILIIDDDALDRAAVRRAFRTSGMATTLAEAEDGNTALALLAQQVFDCILLDYRLPGTDGLAMLHRIRAAGVHAPVIILTGQGDEALAVELMKAGASDYLAKGRVSPNTLASSIHQALRVSRAERERLRTEGRLRLLADMSRMLGASLNYYDNLRNLAAFVVPQLADACAIDVIEQDGQLQRFTMAVSEPLEPVYPLPSSETMLDCDAENGSAAVIRSGVTQAILAMQPGQVPDLQLAPHESVDPPALTSMICVPLMVRNKMIGAVSFARYAGRPAYD
ncbi:MAG TPA: response regulator, partial [Roseiflexaceae bacterium]|nr:response regulator [Roseiflexaceae bacterium]